jgi:hypothetical protein
LPPRSASFEVENGLYLFALTMPVVAATEAKLVLPEKIPPMQI